MLNPQTHWQKLQRSRPLFFQAGLISALSLVIMAFSWTGSGSLVDDIEEVAVYTEDITVIPATRLAPPKAVPINTEPISQPKPPEPDPKPTPPPKPTPKKGPFVEPPPEDFGVDTVPFVLIPQHAAEFPGGYAALENYLAQTGYCNEARELGVEGTIWVSFMINEKGKVSDVELERQLFPCLDRRVALHIQNMPTWKPGMQGYHAVKTRLAVKVRFELN